MSVTGVKDVKAGLLRVNKQFMNNASDAMDEVGKTGKERAQNLTSIDTGNLFDSAFHEQKTIGDNVAVVVGYQAEYAAAVHAMPETTNWQRPGAENEFLEKGMLRHLTESINIMVARMMKGFK